MHRTGQTVWVLVLSAETRPQFAGAAELVGALSGRRALITDFDLHETTAVLDEHGLLGAFHAVIDRGAHRAADPAYMTEAGRCLGVLRRHRVVYLDAHAGAGVAAKLLGWRVCLLSPGRSALKRPAGAGRGADARIGAGAWYDHRFSSLRGALRYFIFGA
jgi:FMN phosphatase YigB (HAD superfamily)